MTVIRKALATVEPVEDSEEYPNGAFDIILSAQTQDRDGDVLNSDEWKTPLPDHITMDSDHGMSVATTVGSGKPFINEDGNLQVRGTFASTDHAQQVRTLVNEGHIRTTSVAFMTEKSTEKDAKPVRELLNGAFVAIPSNREALVLESKSFAVTEKLGARTNADDAQMIQAIHDAAHHLGASCAGDTAEESAEGEPAEKSFTIVAKGIAGSVEDLRERLRCALAKATGPDAYPWLRATFLDDAGSGTVVYECGEDTLARSFADDGATVTLGDDVRSVSLVTTIADPSAKSLNTSGHPAGTPQPSASKSAATAAPQGTAAATEATADDVALRARALEIHARALGNTSTDGTSK
jgi:hypothetical protein